MSWRAGLCEQDFSRAGGSQAMESETAASVSRSISNTTLRESAHPLLGCVQSPSLRCGSWARSMSVKLLRDARKVGVSNPTQRTLRRSMWRETWQMTSVVVSLRRCDSKGDNKVRSTYDYARERCALMYNVCV